MPSNAVLRVSIGPRIDDLMLGRGVGRVNGES